VIEHSFIVAFIFYAWYFAVLIFAVLFAYYHLAFPAWKPFAVAWTTYALNIISYLSPALAKFPAFSLIFFKYNPFIIGTNSPQSIYIPIQAFSTYGISLYSRVQQLQLKQLFQLSNALLKYAKYLASVDVVRFNWIRLLTSVEDMTFHWQKRLK